MIVILLIIINNCAIWMIIDQQLGWVYINQHGKVHDHYQHDEVDDHQRGASEGWHPCPITVMGESLQPAKPLD